MRHKSVNTPLSHERLVGGLQDGGRGTHVTHFVQLYPQPLYTASQVRTTCRSWDEGVLTDLCFTLYSQFMMHGQKNIKLNLAELFTVTRKLKKRFFLQLEMFDVCTTGDTAHIDTIFKLLPHRCWRLCGNNLNIVSMYTVSPMVHTSNISSCQRNFFSFPVVVKNSIKVGRSFSFLVINVIGEHYETPCILIPSPHVIMYVI